MECIKKYFERDSKKVIELNITSTVNNPCSHCGYGNILSGNAIIVSSHSDSDSGDDSDNYDDKEDIDFVYKTGCLSYDGELIY